MSDKNKPAPTEWRRPCGAWIGDGHGGWVARIGPVYAEVFRGTDRWIGVTRHSGHADANVYDSAVAAQLAAEDAAADLARDILRALGRV